MRDFLIEKLKSAEIALKSVMIENAAFRKQTSADQEVCVLHHMPSDVLSIITTNTPSYTTCITSHTHCLRQFSFHPRDWSIIGYFT